MSPLRGDLTLVGALGGEGRRRVQHQKVCPGWWLPWPVPALPGPSCSPSGAGILSNTCRQGKLSEETAHRAGAWGPGKGGPVLGGDTHLQETPREHSRPDSTRPGRAPGCFPLSHPDPHAGPLPPSPFLMRNFWASMPPCPRLLPSARGPGAPSRGDPQTPRWTDTARVVAAPGGTHSPAVGGLASRIHPAKPVLPRPLLDPASLPSPPAAPVPCPSDCWAPRLMLGLER